MLSGPGTMLSLEKSLPVMGLAPAKLSALGHCPGDISALLSCPSTAASAPISAFGLDQNMYFVHMLNGCGTTTTSLPGLQCVGIPGGTLCCACYQGFPAAPAPPPPGTAIAAATVPTVTAITTAYPRQPLATAALPQQPPNGTFHPTQLPRVTRQQLPNGQSLNRQLHHYHNSASSPSFHGNAKFNPRFNRSPSGFPPKGFKRKAEDSLSTDSGDSGNGKSDAGSSTQGELFIQPLYCKICRVTLNAPAQAKQHYEGKNHAKKVKLTDCPSSAEANTANSTNSTDQVTSSPTGSTPPSEPTPPAPAAEINPEIYCKICGVSFNSDKQAQQHYQGKNHAKKVRATDGPGGGGSSDKGRTSYRRGSRYRCFLCNLHLGSKEHLLTHLRGPRHQEKLKSQGGGGGGGGGGGAVTALGGHRWNHNSKDLSRNIPFGITQISHGNILGHNHGYNRAYQHNNNNNNNGTAGAKKPHHDFSMYRTPSGKFYCPACNTTVNSESLFAQHVESKKHKASSVVHRNSVNKPTSDPGKTTTATTTTPDDDVSQNEETS